MADNKLTLASILQIIWYEQLPTLAQEAQIASNSSLQMLKQVWAKWGNFWLLSFYVKRLVPMDLAFLMLSLLFYHFKGFILLMRPLLQFCRHILLFYPRELDSLRIPTPPFSTGLFIDVLSKWIFSNLWSSSPLKLLVVRLCLIVL